jgi:hypothetical protein
MPSQWFLPVWLKLCLHFSSPCMLHVLPRPSPSIWLP